MATAKSDSPRGNGNGPRTPEDLEAEIEQLKAEIAQLTKTIQSIGQHSYGAAKRAAAEGLEQLRGQGEEAIANLRGSASDIERQLADTVREKPVTALAVAAGIGFLFALMSRR